MKTFDFLADRLPFGYAFNFDNYLFNKAKHLNTQGVPDRADYFLVNNVRKRIEAKIHFLLLDGVAYSPYKSLFGGFEFNPRLQSTLLMDFWAFIEADLKNRGMAEISITSFAGGYAPKKALKIHAVMENAGFSVVHKALNHHIPIDEHSLENRMHPMEVRRLRKCVEEGCRFVEEPSEYAEEIYDYLEACRKEQGLEVSISMEQLQMYLREFPQSYLLFSVRKGDTLLAATVAVKVHRQILYNFLPGSLRKHKVLSPTVMLYDGLYQYASERGFELLDLGISTLKNGRHQKSLIDFKTRMGGQASEKLTYHKMC